MDLFCGKNAPVGAALTWCGWLVEPVDILFGPDYDLADSVVQKQVAQRCEEVDACMWAPDCSTLSAAREKRLPIPGGGPAALRSATCVKGAPGLSSKDQDKVNAANKFVEFTLAAVEKSAARGIGHVVENTRRS